MTFALTWRVFAASLLALAGSAALASDVAVKAILEQGVQQGVARGYPGFAVAVQAAEGPATSAAAGFSDVENGRVLQPDEPFHIGSITKVFTAVAALRLVDAGKLSLDSTLSSLLGAVVQDIPNARKITVAQLLDHSSGIYPTNNDLDYISTLLGPMADPSRIFTPLELVALAEAKRQKPTNDPGKKHSYSDSNYTLLGLIVEKISGVPFKDHIRQTILVPLNMQATRFYSDDILQGVDTTHSMVQGYMIATSEIRGIIAIHPDYKAVPGQRRPEGELLNTTRASERNDAAGGMLSTLPDLLRFGSALFHGRLLTPESQSFLAAAATSPPSLEGGEQRTWTLQATRKPYGILLYKQGDGPGGTTALLAYLPSQDLIFAGFTNSFGYFDEVDFMLDTLVGNLEQAYRNRPAPETGNAPH